ncbi:Putative flippase GtrA (transmembrane translocase of bactoprenol-linked glucose) [Agromyces sp. CF514]|uniref:GtrA family protein n=1 Tax=Agromyces sp. CF514 TaxID=1881031 RepID=UPI0008F31095|nr:GtrA family protein [Agromyces sp. CF514]SFR74599.1 Putative flippase GtrA (transmembrane translocase of bactoprenol-linked glucose) [Agromyces sp. CF514]
MFDRRLVRQLVSFIGVGGAGLVIDVGLFNLLTLTVLHPGVHGGVLLAKTLSSAVAILANWIGNRTLTFRGQGRPDRLRESLEFALVSVAGSMIAVGCLWLSHYGLHLTSQLADNLAANVVGLALGSAFRFVLYRNWVFGADRVTEPAG